MDAARGDGLEAVRYVRENAKRWALSPHRIGIMGFSAGAVTTVGVALQADKASRPDLIASIYGLLPDANPVTAEAPPAFLAVAADDLLVSRSTLEIYLAWRHAGVPAELHIFEAGHHGFGIIQQGTSSDQWPALFDCWLKAHGFEGSKNR